MKKFYSLVFILICCIAISGFSQTSPIPVKLKGGDFYPQKNITGDQFDISILSLAKYDNKYFILVQFDRIPSASEKLQIKNLGITLEEYLPANAWLAFAGENTNFNALRSLGLHSAVPLPADKKVDPNLLMNLEKANDGSHLVAVNYFSSMNRETVASAIVRSGLTVIPYKFEKQGILYVRGDAPAIREIATLPFVIYIASQAIEDKPVNYNNRGAHGNDALYYNGAGGRNLSGHGVVVGVGDNADVSTHIDFAGRLINRTPWYVDAHGTHTTGTAAGGGILDARTKGMAPRATIVSQFYSDVIDNADIYFTDYNLNLTNNSYHSAEGACAGEGVYDFLSNFGDAQVKNNDKLLHVFASGNDGSFTCSPYPNAYATIKSGWQCAKNVLTVGASDNFNNIISYFSSRGPVQDGRLKPEIVAGGWAISSTTPNNSYGLNYGTSMAAPTVTGSIALITERYKQLHGNDLPKAGLLKALVCNTAEDMGNAGPDFTFGFGNLNTRRAVEALEANRYFVSSVATGGTNVHSIIVPPGAYQLKVLVNWIDKEASPNASVTLVNDLDLVVTEPALPLAVNHQPLVLDPSPAGVGSPAVEGADHRNNIEQVVINNPAAGVYTLTVSGYAVPYGPQEYFLTYEIVMSGVTVEYPFGGETMVNNETENIRWNAYGANNELFTVEYSDDNGATWNVISNNVPANARKYAWSVPIGLYTNDGLVRVTRNNTAYTDQSDHNFMILGRPVLTATQLCEGAVQLTWNAQSNATSYDILKLDVDTMKVIGTASVTAYSIYGLNRADTGWYSVRAVNNGVAGRPAVSVRVIPNGGPCTLTDFDNDIALLDMPTPVNGRIGTSTAGNATQPISVILKNLDDVSTTATFNISYSINGMPAITETIAPTISAGGTYSHTFAQHSLLPPPATYNIVVWINRSGDIQTNNDTIRKTVRLLSNPALNLPFLENFESTGVNEFRNGTVGLGNLEAFDFFANTSRGRVRTFVNSGISYSGNRALTLDQAPFSISSNTDSLLMTANLSNYSLTSDQLRLDFMFRNHGQQNYPGNKVWLRGSDTDQWIEAVDLFSKQASIGKYKKANGINLNDLLSAAIPPQNVTSSFQVKFGEQGFTSANSPAAVSDLDDGYTFDDIQLTKAVNDVAMLAIISPSVSGCGLTATNPVTIKVRNYNNVTINNISVAYRINNGSVITESIAQLNPDETLNYTFTTTANLSAFTDYVIDAWINYSPDTYKSNDSIVDLQFHGSPLVTTFPYLEGFEANNGNWFVRGTNPSWQWGTPTKTIINKAANGTKAWVTSLTGKYKHNELSYLYSPCFDLHNLVQPVLSFSHIFKLEDDCDCDYHWVEYSTDGGLTWQKLGSAGAGTNWYTNVAKQRWQASKTKWHVASIDVPTSSTSVRFRFVLETDMGVSYEGVGIDDIHIFDKATIYTGPTVTGISQPVSGTNWVHFNSGGNRVVSINPNGQTLGATNVSAYMNTGPVVNKFNEYHLDRNLVIKPSIPLVAPVGIRFYFTDAEAELLINATGCTNCTSIKDAYEAAILKYNGPAGEENGTLNDNTSGSYTLISPANVLVVPYNNGYYAEFNVSSLSELWINDGNPQFPPLPITLLSFDAIKEGKGSRLNWITSQEINSKKFIIEKSADGISFSSLGEVMAKGNASANSLYSFRDAAPFNGINFYRLRMIDRDGAFKISPIRKVDFSLSADISLYPNPVTADFLNIESVSIINKTEVYTSDGKRLETFFLSGNKITLDFKNIAAGMYSLKIFTANGVHIEKITRL